MHVLRALVLILVALDLQGSVEVLGEFEPGWQEAWGLQQLGGGETSYRVVREGGEPVLRADASGSATAFYRPVDLAPVATRISWRWKVAGSLAGNTRELERAGDDYAARLFVIFGDGQLSAGTRALCYVWAAARGVGSSYRSPVADSVMTIVVQSGDEHAGVWMEQTRDLAADYRRAFGRDPEPVGAVALLVDTDDTGRQATAWYDDIVLR